jgi:hypothetical protein
VQRVTALPFRLATGENAFCERMSSPAKIRVMPALSVVRSIAIAIGGFLIGLAFAAMAVPLAAHAKSPPPQPITDVPDGSKTISIIVYGNDACPPGKGDEIVVCARQPESERYRIPKRFREKPQDTAPNNSWANKVRSTEDASRTAAGIPDTCSSVGTGGQSGCYAHFVTQMNQEKLQQAQEKADNSDGTPPPN